MRTCLALVLCLVAQHALAASEADWNTCRTSRDVDKAIPACTRIIDEPGISKADRFKALERRAIANSATGLMGAQDGFRRAAADASEMIRIDESSARGYELRGDARHYLNELQDAIDDFNAAIARAPTAKNYFARAYALQHLGLGEHAVADYDMYLRLNPEDLVSALFNRGHTYVGLGQYDKAIQDFDAGLAKDPSEYGRLVGLLGRGEARFHLGHTGRAISDLNAVIAGASSPAMATMKCTALFLFDRSAEALTACNEALGVLKDDRDALGYRGLVHLKLKNDALALADFRAITQVSPADPLWRFGLGLARMRTGDSDGASDLARARKDYPRIEAVFRRFALIGDLPRTSLAAALAAPATPTRTRDVFIYSTGRFTHLGGGKWREDRTDGRPSSHFTETARTDQFVEMFDRDRKMSVRLFERHGSWVQAGASNWAPWPGSNGGWQE